MRTNKHEGHVRTFTILSQSWYADASAIAERRAPGGDVMQIGFSAPEGGTSGEFCIRWKPLDRQIVPQLQAFDDSWSALAGFSDVLAKLAEVDGTNPTVDQVAEILKSCGVVDATERTSPYTDAPSSDEARVTSLANVLTVYKNTLAQFQEIGRKASGDSSWAARAEFGVRVEPLPSISEDLYLEVVEKAGAVARLREKLAASLGKLKNDALIKQYAALTSET